ncbi:MAG: PAS domain-containing protein [Gemmatirosa sp.]|nr:PAS domain-containing protein [Gemmatirosa sp.]
MPEPVGPTSDAELLRDDRLEEFLGDLAAAPDAVAAGQRLTDAFLRASGAERARLYVLDEGEGALRLAGTSPGGVREENGRSLIARDESHPFFVAALSLYALAGEPAAAPSGFEPGVWIAVPLPQPRLSRSSAPVGLDEAGRRAGDGWRLVTMPHGERRRRIGLAPLGVVALHLGDRAADVRAAVEALMPAATLAGPILSRGLAVEQYRETAERLDRQRDLLSEIIDSLPDPVLLTGATSAESDMGVLVQNQRAARLFSADGISDARYLAATERNSALLAAVLGGAWRAGGDASELRLTDPATGDELVFEVGDHALGGERRGARLLVLRDVTALRAASAQLERQVERAQRAERVATRERDRLDLILDYVADPIVVTDMTATIVQSNRQAARLLPDLEPTDEARAAVDPDEATRRAENRRTFTAFIEPFTRGGESTRRGRLTFVHPASGNALPLEVVAGTVTDQSGESTVVVSVLHDLTTQTENERLYEELKRFSAVLEARVRAATTDLAEQNARLQWQSGELERASRLKSEFLASMSHELRTPINALIGYTALLRDHVYGELNPRQEDGLRRIHTSAEHLLALINDILDLARIEAGRMPVHMERTRLAPLLREAAQHAEPAARAKGIEFALELPPEPEVVHTDPEKLKQVLVNLLSNAVKFTAHGRVTLRAEHVGDRVRIDVADTGIGVRPEDQALIWQDFRQLDQSRTREYGGTGLGLSIVRKLAERLDATVGLTSEPGVGSVFSVTVPASSPPGD